VKPHLWFIHFIGLIVPRRLRADWRQEWEAELRYRETLLADWDRLDRGAKLDLLWRSASAFWDALWLQPQRWEDEMFQDLRFGARMLMKHSGFTLVAVLTLALGIGVNTTLFTVYDAFVLKPLPLKDPYSIANVTGYDREGKRNQFFSYPDYLDYRDRNAMFAGLIAWNIFIVPFGAQAADGGDASAPLANLGVGQLVSGNYFAVL